MPRGIPSIFNKERRRELAQSMPSPEVLGTLDPNARILDPKTRPEPVEWTREDGTVMSIQEEAPPWELQSDKFTQSDARMFVECPPNWRLHWINPRLLEQEGWRDWQAVQASDPRVKVRVPAMRSPEGYIRRGGPSGDILTWKWEGWYQKARQENLRRTAQLAQSAVDKQQQLKEEMNRGSFGQHIHMDSAAHPTHTMGEGRTMRDN